MKESLIVTIICLFGCLLGSFSAGLFLVNYNLVFIFFISFGSSFLSCLLLLTFWEMYTNKWSFYEAVIRSYKRSIVSIMILVLSENILFVILSIIHSTASIDLNQSNSITIMTIALSISFVLTFAFNFIQFQKREKLHLSKLEQIPLKVSSSN